MNPAGTSQRKFDQTQLLILSDQAPRHAKFGEIAGYLQPGDLLIVNNSATLPSSFNGHVGRTGQPVELRLAAFQGTNTQDLRHWLAFSFGSGDWKIPTEKRGPAPQILPGDQIIFGEDLIAKDLIAEITEVRFDRLLRIRFVSPHLPRALYRWGRPIQYSYLQTELKVWDQQTIFSGLPISVEPPSAGFQMTWEMTFKLKAKGVGLASVTHAAGISSTGSESLDGLLPLPEYYEVSQATVDQVQAAKKGGHRIVALGTTVLRALESAMNRGELQASRGLTKLKISSQHPIQSATSLVTGMHELGTSHRQILNAFCGPQMIEAGYQEAEQRGYLDHEYGDLSLLDCKGCRCS